MKLLLEVIFLLGMLIGGFLTINLFGETDFGLVLGCLGLVIFFISFIVFLYIKKRKG